MISCMNILCKACSEIYFVLIGLICVWSPHCKNRLRECGVLTLRIPRSNNLSRVKNTEPWDKTIRRSFLIGILVVLRRLLYAKLPHLLWSDDICKYDIGRFYFGGWTCRNMPYKYLKTCLLAFCYHHHPHHHYDHNHHQYRHPHAELFQCI